MPRTCKLQLFGETCFARLHCTRGSYPHWPVCRERRPGRKLSDSNQGDATVNRCFILFHIVAMAIQWSFNGVSECFIHVSMSNGGLSFLDFSVKVCCNRVPESDISIYAKATWIAATGSVCRSLLLNKLLLNA